MNPLDYFVKHHEDWVRMAHSVSTDAEEVLQEAYLKIHKSFCNSPERLKEMHYNQLSIYMWLTIKSCAVKVWKENGIYTELSNQVEEEDECYTEGPDQVVLIQKVQREVSKFDWYNQKLFNLHYEQEIPMRKISRETGISLSSIFHTLKNCRKQIKSNIENELRGTRQAD